MKKTILIYLTGMSRSGGKERVVANLLCEWIKRYNIIMITKEDTVPFYKIPDEVCICPLKPPFLTRMFDLKEKKIYRIVFTFINMVCSCLLLRKRLKSVEYDYLYVSTPLNAFEAFYAMRNSSQKLVISEHASINAYNGIYAWMKKKIYPKAYCVSVPNSMDTDVYKQWECNAVFIPHLITYKAEEKNSLNSKIVLNIGRLTKDKRQELLIRMWANIEEKNGWKLLIVGDGEEKENLDLIIRSLSQEDTIKLLPARKDIKTLYKNASLFAFTSRTEGFGMVLLEAMAFGIPCISFDCPSGPRDIIKDGCNGFLIENDDARSFTLKLKEILELKEYELKQLGEGAFKTVEAWNNEKILNKWEEIFK